MLVGALVSCTEGSGGGDAAVGQSPSPTATIGFVNGGDCPPADDPGLPGDAGCASTLISGGDSLTVYARLNEESRPRSWRIRLTTPAGTVEGPLEAGNAYSYPRALGVADIQDDGAPEWWVKATDYTSHGAPWSGAWVFTSANEGPPAPILLGAEPLVVNYGGIARLGEGATCGGGRLVLLRAEAQNVRNTRWRVSRRFFEVNDEDAAQLVKREEGSLSITDYNDPDLDPYYRIDCHGFVFPS